MGLVRRPAMRMRVVCFRRPPLSIRRTLMRLSRPIIRRLIRPFNRSSFTPPPRLRPALRLDQLRLSPSHGLSIA